MREWERDLDWSAEAFSELVWPILHKKIGGRLIHVEKITEIIFAKDFDRLSGIDAWHIKNGKGIRGIAIRIQICKPEFNTYNTFTIRKSRDKSRHLTEYQKRKMAIYSDKGYLYPHLTVQSYISDKVQNNGYLRALAVAKTKKIIDFIDSTHCQTKRASNAEFYIIPWTTDICEFIN